VEKISPEVKSLIGELIQHCIWIDVGEQKFCSGCGAHITEHSPKCPVLKAAHLLDLKEHTEVDSSAAE